MANGLRPHMPPGTTVDLQRIESTAATYAVGDVIRISSGQAALLTAATQLIHGAAAEAGAKGSAATLLFYPARPGMVWEGRAAGTPTQAQIGTQVDFSVFTTNGMQINTASTVNGQVTFVGKKDFTRAFGANSDILVTINAAFNSWEGT